MRNKKPSWANDSLGRNYAPESKTTEPVFDWKSYRPDTNWRDELATLLWNQVNDGKSTQTSKEAIHANLVRHTRHSTADDSAASHHIEQYLIKLHAVMTGKIKPPGKPEEDLDPETLQGIALELVEGLPRCGNGIFERVKTVWDRLETPASLANLLSSYRKELIDTLARNNFKEDGVGPGAETHRVNYYLSVANKMKVNLSGVADTHTDRSYHDEKEIMQRIETVLLAQYTPLGIMRYIESQIFTPPLTPPDASALNVSVYSNATREYVKKVQEHNETLQANLKSILQKLNMDISDKLQEQFLLSTTIRLQEKPPEDIMVFTDINWKEIRKLIFDILTQLDIVAPSKQDKKITLRPSLENAQQFDYWLQHIAESQDIVTWLKDASADDKAKLLRLYYTDEKRHQALINAFSTRPSILQSIEKNALEKQKGVDNCAFINSADPDVAKTATKRFIAFVKSFDPQEPSFDTIKKMIEGLKTIRSDTKRFEVIIATVNGLSHPSEFLSSLRIAALLKLMPTDKWLEFFSKIEHHFSLYDRFVVIQDLGTQEEKIQYINVLNQRDTVPATHKLFDSLRDAHPATYMRILKLAPPGKEQLALIQYAIQKKQLAKFCRSAVTLRMFFNTLDQKTQSELLNKNPDMIKEVILTSITPPHPTSTSTTEIIEIISKSIKTPEDRLAFLMHLKTHAPAIFAGVSTTIGNHDKDSIELLNSLKNHPNFGLTLIQDLLPSFMVTLKNNITLSGLNFLLQSLPKADIETLISKLDINKLTGLVGHIKKEEDLLTLLDVLGKITPDLQRQLVDELMKASEEPGKPPPLIFLIQTLRTVDVLQVLEKTVPEQRLKIIDRLMTIDSFKNPMEEFITLPPGKLLSAIKLLSPDLQIALLNDVFHEVSLQRFLRNLSPHEWIDLFTTLPDAAKIRACEICKNDFAKMLNSMQKNNLELLLPLLPLTLIQEFQRIISVKVFEGKIPITTLPENSWASLVENARGVDIITILNNIAQDKNAYGKLIHTIMIDWTDQLDISDLVTFITTNPEQLNTVLQVLEPEAVAKLIETMGDDGIKQWFDKTPHPCSTLKIILDQMSLEKLPEETPEETEKRTKEKKQALINHIGLENIFSKRQQNDWMDFANFLPAIPPEAMERMLNAYQSQSESDWVLAHPAGTSFSERNELLDALVNFKPEHVKQLLESLTHPIFKTIDELQDMFHVIGTSGAKQSMLIQCLNANDQRQLLALAEQKNATLSGVFSALQNSNKRHELISKLDARIINQLSPHVRHTLFSSISNASERCALEMHYILKLATPNVSPENENALLLNNTSGQIKAIAWLAASLTEMSDVQKQIYIDKFGIDKIASIITTAEQFYTIQTLMPEGLDYTVRYVDDKEALPNPRDANCIYVFNHRETSEIRDENGALIAEELTNELHYLVGASKNTERLELDDLEATPESVHAHQDDIIASVIDNQHALPKYRTAFTAEIEKNPALMAQVKTYAAEFEKIKIDLTTSITDEIAAIGKKPKPLQVFTGKSDAVIVKTLNELKTFIQTAPNRSAILEKLTQKQEETPESEKRLKETLQRYITVFQKEPGNARQYR